MIQDLEEKDSLREDAAKKREEEKRRLVMKIQDLDEEGRKLIASMEKERETDSLLKLSEYRRNDVEE
jgi:hypothetical protein